MVDTLGYRKKFGVIAPSTNTIVEPEYAWLQPDGVTNHHARITIPDDPVTDDQSFETLIDTIRLNTMSAIDSVMTCSPDYLVVGMSAETFWDGAQRASELHKDFESRAGVGVAMGSHACRAALKAYSEEKEIKRIAVLTPYMPVGDRMVERFFNDIGYDVTRVLGLKSPSPRMIAHESESKLRDAVMQLEQDRPDAIIQCGTNLAFMRVAAEAEQQLRKPVIAINTATYWYALRQTNICDQISGLGRLMSNW